MSLVAVIGAETPIAGFALAGALPYPAATNSEVQAAWAALPAEVAVVVLTNAAAAALGDDLLLQSAPLSVVMPQ